MRWLKGCFRDNILYIYIVTWVMEQKYLATESAKKKSLRVALIVSERTICEYSIFLDHLLTGLANDSIPVALVFPSGFNADSVFTGTAEVISHPVIDLPLLEHLNIRLLAERLRKFKPTVLHCLCESSALLTRRLAHLLDLPYVLMVNSLQKRRGKFSISSRYCAKIIVPSKTISDNIAEVYPCFADRIRQINIGTFVAEGTGCFSEPFRLATMVMAHPLDNVDYFENLFNAVRHLLIDDYEFMMVVMGCGRSERQLWKLLAALDLLQTVTIVPRLKPWSLVLSAGDIFIQPRPSLIFNTMLLEAMSIGSAVAGCKGGIDDLIIEDRTAVVFDPNDELSVMHTLKQLLDRREIARQIAKAAQQYLRENHTVNGMISATLQTYCEAQG